MNASVAIQVLPTVTDENEVIRIVDEVIDYIKSTGLNYYVGPCETSIEGDYDELMEIVKNCQLVSDIKIIYDKQSIGFQGTQKTVMSLKPFLFSAFRKIVNKIHVSNILMKITCIFYI